MGRSLLLHVVPGGLGPLHAGSCVWRHQSQDSPCNQANDHHHDEGCRLKDRRGLCAGSCPPGEDPFKNAHQELGDAVDGAHKAAVRVRPKSLEDQAKSQNNFNYGEDYANNSF